MPSRCTADGLFFCLVGHFFKLPRLTPPFWVDHNLKQLWRPLSFSLQSSTSRAVEKKLEVIFVCMTSQLLSFRCAWPELEVQELFDSKWTSHSTAHYRRGRWFSDIITEFRRTWLSKAFKYIFISLQSIVCERHCATSNFATGHKHLGLKIIFTSFFTGLGCLYMSIYVDWI